MMNIQCLFLVGVLPLSGLTISGQMVYEGTNAYFLKEKLEYPLLCGVEVI